MTATPRATRLFALRMWQEEPGDGQLEWRGKVQALPDGEAYYFRDWPGWSGIWMRCWRPGEIHQMRWG